VCWCLVQEPLAGLMSYEVQMVMLEIEPAPAKDSCHVNDLRESIFMEMRGQPLIVVQESNLIR
jgi:hypothetical protein